jgi:DNA-binding response OmpR family regulator
MNDKKKVIIIEDERILGDILLNKFRNEGFDAYWEIDGIDGLNKIREIKPDIVLLDLVMPRKDGYEVLEDMGKDEALKSIPVIIISNSGQPVELKRIIELGAKDYIIKAQFSPEEVFEKVRKYIDKKEDGTIEQTEQKNAAGVKILVVEDDPFLSSLTSVRLSKDGYKVTVASDGRQALKALEEDIPDLVLLDVIMPGMNGFDVLREIKANDRYKNMSVIIFSNLGQDHEIEEGKKLGADDFMVKANFTLREVAEKISTLLKKKGRL